jgi:hypothetical protein
MVMLKLCSHKKVSYNASIIRNLYTNSTFNCPRRGQIMGVSSDPA